MPERDHQGAVIWKGYVRLPKAGTYYFTTVSDDGSSIYVNQSRVALNARFGGTLPSDAFTYADSGATPTINPAANTYVVPVPVTAPRVFPIEVRYAAYNASSNHGFGIDLYWVTPDAKRDSSGKPIAELVPTEALSTEPPSGMESALVSRPHSTISSDFLYLPFDQGVAATLTIRLADQHGRPVAGRRVHVSGLADYGKQDLITQPERPPDANGITTATVKGYTVEHTATFFATDLTDFVDVAQTAEVNITRSPRISFLPPAYSPYYDPKLFQISPMPVRVGQPTRISVPLTNHQKTPARLHVRVLSNEPNIGLADWTPIGETEPFVLQPGETQVASLTWTPTTPSSHLCFEVEVWGTVGEPRATNSLLSNSIAYAQLYEVPGSRKVVPCPRGNGLCYRSTYQRNFGPLLAALGDVLTEGPIEHYLRNRHDAKLREQWHKDWQERIRQWKESGGKGPRPGPPPRPNYIRNDVDYMMKLYKVWKATQEVVGGPEKRRSICACGKA